MVIVKSKLTGKFLRHHSGSASDFARRIRWQVDKDKEFLASLPPREEADESNRAEFWRIDTPRKRAIRNEVHARMYDADAMDARRYTTPGSALTSIGKWTGKSYIGSNKPEPGERVHTLPEHLELHEIVAGNLCIVDINDDDETKARKKRNCK